MVSERVGAGFDLRLLGTLVAETQPRAPEPRTEQQGQESKESVPAGLTFRHGQSLPAS